MFKPKPLAVFVSSTSEDLKSHRAAAKEIILELGWLPGGGPWGIGVTYEPSPAVRVGIAALDLAGSQERFARERRRNPSAALGVAFYQRRFHYGADVQGSREVGWDASAGVSLRLTNDIDIALGALPRQRSARLVLRLFGITLSARYAATGDERLEGNFGGSWQWPL